MSTRTKPRRPVPAVYAPLCVERPRPAAEPGSCCPFARFNGDVELPDEVVRAWIRQERLRAEAEGRTRVSLLLSEAAQEEADVKALRPDLGSKGPAALARPTIDTEVRTRGHGKIVARTVLTQPLDVYAHDGHISDAQLEAGHRVAKSLRSWQASRVTARYPVASDPGLDDDEEDLTDEEREQQRANRRATRLEAERVVGPRAWPTVKAVCEGYFLGRLGSMALLREGLQALVVGWKIPERVVESA